MGRGRGGSGREEKRTRSRCRSLGGLSRGTCDRDDLRRAAAARRPSARIRVLGVDAQAVGKPPSTTFAGTFDGTFDGIAAPPHHLAMSIASIPSISPSPTRCYFSRATFLPSLRRLFSHNIHRRFLTSSVRLGPSLPSLPVGSSLIALELVVGLTSAPPYLAAPISFRFRGPDATPVPAPAESHLPAV
jgi:hypothetical protein